MSGTTTAVCMAAILVVTVFNVIAIVVGDSAGWVVAIIAVSAAALVVMAVASVSDLNRPRR